MINAPIDVDYDEAIRMSAGWRRHLLLGNGFSIAARQRFHYDELRLAADAAQGAGAVLSGHEDANFEEIMAALLRSLSSALDTGVGAELIEKQIADLRQLLVGTVAVVHPDSSFAMRANELRSCADFLVPYIGRAAIPHGIVFTVNYDLLLYWTAIQFARKSGGPLSFYDGFEGDFWLPDRMKNTSLSVVYLHGSLHMFERDRRITRIRYQNGPVPRNLLSQIREALANGDAPVFVAEGTGDRKADRIAANAYLAAAQRKFYFACRDARDSLFTVGHSLSKQDTHLTNMIGSGRIGRVFIGAFGGLNSSDGRRASELASEWQAMRSSEPKYMPLEVFVFDSQQCRIWSRFDDIEPNEPDAPFTAHR